MGSSVPLILLLLLFALLAIGWVIFPLRPLSKGVLLFLPISMALIFSGYFYWGGFSLWQDYERKKEAQALLQSIKSPQELIIKLEERLKQKPQSAKGWYLLGRLYSSQNQQQKALSAFEKASALESSNALYKVNYAHTIWRLNHQKFTNQVIDLFEEILKEHPGQMDSLAMLAMNAYAKKDYEKAIVYWQKLLALLPAQSEEAKAISQAIVKAQQQKN